jgi:hypothetical protein
VAVSLPESMPVSVVPGADAARQFGSVAQHESGAGPGS